MDDGPPPDRFELAIWERLGPVLRAVAQRRERALLRQAAARAGFRALAEDEHAPGEAEWAEVAAAYARAAERLNAVLDDLRDAAVALERMRHPRHLPRR
jgi:hypothetical protein